MNFRWSALKAWSLGFVLIIALPVTDLFEVPHFRAISLSLFVAIFFFELMSKRARLLTPTYTAVCGLLILSLLCGLIFTRAPHYGAMKTGLFFCYFAILGFLVANWAKDISLQRAFVNGILFGGGLIVALFMIKFGDPLQMMRRVEQYYRFSLGESGNPIHLARYLGIFALLVVITKLRARSAVLKILALLAASTAIMYMGLTGSKGPVISLFLGFVVAGLCWSERLVHSVISVLVGSLLFVGGIAIFVTAMPDEFVNQRIFEKLSTLSNRLPVYEETITWISESTPIQLFIGHGTGDFGFKTLSADIRAYPHNIFLELGYENGLIGLSLGIFCFLWPLITGWNARFARIDADQRVILAGAMGAYTYWIANAQFTGDLGSNSFLGCFAGLLVAVATGVKQAAMQPLVAQTENALGLPRRQVRRKYPNLLR